MDRIVYDRMSDLEEDHWWFAARRKLIRTILDRVASLPDKAAILEAGCGTGGNLALLGEFGSVDAFEFDEAARTIAEGKSGLSIPFGALPDDLPFDDRSYDAICLFDVLEHIEDDAGSLRALAGRLRSGGQIVVTVPAFPLLWSRHDVRHHHFRRYTRAAMLRVADAAALEITADGYFNTALLPLAVGSRAINGLLRREVADEAMPGAFVNGVLYRVFAAERHLIGRLRMPVGLSYYAVLRPKP